MLAGINFRSHTNTKLRTNTVGSCPNQQRTRLCPWAYFLKRVEVGERTQAFLEQYARGHISKKIIMTSSFRRMFKMLLEQNSCQTATI